MPSGRGIHNSGMYMAHNFPKETKEKGSEDLENLRKQYNYSIRTIEKVTKLRDLNPADYLNTHYDYILDYWGNLAQKQLFEINYIEKEKEIEEATL